MTQAAPHDITALLKAWACGDAGALNELTPVVYDELRRIARRHLRQRSPQTFQTTELAHEAYLRLVRADGMRWQDRAHFFAVAAQMMRRILIDEARARVAVKRQGAVLRVTFRDDLPVLKDADSSLIAVDDALNALAKVHARKAQVVEMRYFGGLSVEESAEVLQVSPETVKRDWKLAKSWLAREILRGGPNGT